MSKLLILYKYSFYLTLTLQLSQKLILNKAMHI